jgi:hypothetical protein
MFFIFEHPNEERMYEQHDMKTEGGNITSKCLAGFSVDLKEIFYEE